MRGDKTAPQHNREARKLHFLALGLVGVKFVLHVQNRRSCTRWAKSVGYNFASPSFSDRSIRKEPIIEMLDVLIP